MVIKNESHGPTYSVDPIALSVRHFHETNTGRSVAHGPSNDAGVLAAQAQRLDLHRLYPSLWSEPARLRFTGFSRLARYFAVLGSLARFNRLRPARVHVRVKDTR